MIRRLHGISNHIEANCTEWLGSIIRHSSYGETDHILVMHSVHLYLMYDIVTAQPRFLYYDPPLLVYIYT